MLGVGVLGDAGDRNGVARDLAGCAMSLEAGESMHLLTGVTVLSLAMAESTREDTFACGRLPKADKVNVKDERCYVFEPRFTTGRCW